MVFSYNRLWKLLIDRKMKKKELCQLADTTKKFLTVELSMGQMVEDVRLATKFKKPVEFFGRTGGMMPSVNEVLENIEKYAE